MPETCGCCLRAGCPRLQCHATVQAADEAITDCLRATSLLAQRAEKERDAARAQLASADARAEEAAAREAAVMESLDEILNYRGGADDALHDECVMGRAEVALDNVSPRALALLAVVEAARAWWVADQDSVKAVVAAEKALMDALARLNGKDSSDA